jgi:hypothetical protein
MEDGVTLEVETPARRCSVVRIPASYSGHPDFDLLFSDRAIRTETSHSFPQYLKTSTGILSYKHFWVDILITGHAVA